MHFLRRPLINFSSRCSVLGRHDLCSTFYRDQARHLRERDALMGYLIRNQLSECVGVQDEGWARVVKFFKPAFSADRARVFANFAAQMASDWVRQNVSTGTGLDLNLARLLPFNIMIRYVYGEDLSDSDAATLHGLHVRHAAITGAISPASKLAPWLWYLPLRANRELRSFLRDWRAFNQKFLRRYQNSDFSDDRTDLFFVCAKAAADAAAHGTPGLTEDEVRPRRVVW
jgi:hypothetical protein